MDAHKPLEREAGTLTYRWLLFDADGTLFDYHRAERLALERAFAGIGIPFDARCLTAYQQINSEMWRALEKALITPEALKVRRFELLFQVLDISDSPTNFSAAYLDELSKCAELIEGAQEVIQILAKRCRIAILTNGLQTVQRGRLARSAIRDHIAEIIISEELGSAKPAREFFDAAFVRLGHPAKSEVLMIGDNWSSDILGGFHYGIDTCWYNPDHRQRPDQTEITREIASLQELTGWLG